METYQEIKDVNVRLNLISLMSFKESSSIFNAKDIIEGNPYTNVWELIKYIEDLNAMHPN